MRFICHTDYIIVGFRRFQVQLSHPFRYYEWFYQGFTFSKFICDLLNQNREEHSVFFINSQD